MTAKAVDGQEKILIPGDPERELSRKRKTEGIFKSGGKIDDRATVKGRHSAHDYPF